MVEKTPCLVIAEIGVNHNGDVETAKRMINEAHAVGANIVKFQAYITKNLTVPGHPLEAMLQERELGQDALYELHAYAKGAGIDFLVSVFDEESLNFVVSHLEPQWIKVPSGELTNLPFLEQVAAQGLYTFISTGMSRLSEVEAAVEIFEKAGNSEICLMHCTSIYPATPSEANLRAMLTMHQAFGYSVGYSDHTTGAVVPIVAAALGASVLEKHFTLDREAIGPDHRASMEPEDFRHMIWQIRAAEEALGDGRKRPVQREEDTARWARKRLVATVDITAGTVIREEMVEARRADEGIEPNRL